MIKKYRKTALIEAVQLTWANWSEICEFARVGKLEDNKPSGCYIGPSGQALPNDQASDIIGMFIPTLEGVMLARQNDWIAKGPAGELWPIKPEIFAATYVEV